MVNELGTWARLGTGSGLRYIHEVACPTRMDQAYSTSAQHIGGAILKGSLADFATSLPTEDPPRWLSGMSMKLIIKFARTDILEYLESSHKDPFWAMSGHKYLPTKASVVFPQSVVLEWLETSASFLTKDYSTDTIDLASKAGFIHVLEWWRCSGLPVRSVDFRASIPCPSNANTQFYSVTRKPL